jgi:hypothetical protein
MKSRLLFALVFIISTLSIAQQDLSGIWAGKLDLPNSVGTYSCI